MYPKLIHYCWFGNGRKPECFFRCQDSWKSFFPGWNIIEWNETNYDYNVISYTREAYSSKKYAFVSDYTRLDILYQYGGIYFDVDVEVLKPFDMFFDDKAFGGMDQYGLVSTGLVMGAIPEQKIIKELRDDYTGRHFINSDKTLNLTACPVYQTEFLKKRGYIKGEQVIQKINGLTIYPSKYFCPKTRANKPIKTKDAYTIHYANASWLPLRQKLKKRILALFGENVFYLIRFKAVVKKIFLCDKK